MDRELVSRQEAAKLLGGISMDTLGRMVERGVLVAYRIGRRLMIDRESVSQYLDKCRIAV